ncbi:hypothetical protein JW998_14675 [candidate division KSB1 bacterium]|nr:hypothetical protein [candidate division KSB1 bacterium]
MRNGLIVQQAIQVCESLRYTDVREREIRSLVECSHELGVSESLVLSAEDDQQELVVENVTIQVKPIWQWLLEAKG